MGARYERRQPCLFRPEAIHDRRIALGLKTQALADALGVEQRRLEYWLSGDAKRRPDLMYAETLAELLGVGVEEICTVIPEDARVLAKGGRDALRVLLPLLSLDKWRVGHALKDPWVSMTVLHRLLLAVRAHWDRYASYAAYVSFRHWPLTGYARRHVHPGQPAHEYLEFRITPSLPSARGQDATFVVGYTLGPARIDYGSIRIVGRRVLLEAYFSNHREQARLNSDDSFRFRTWVGPDAADFIVQGNLDFRFEARYTGRRDLFEDKDPEEEDVVGFLPSPHDRVASARRV
ncbi:MAG: helix-turn-helix transcriptional regulator, partial [Myxococcales bacterium]